MDFDLPTGAAVLERTPGTLRAMLDGLAPPWADATWVAHDLGHIAQSARVMARQYREAIGPWRAYLPIMDR